MLKVDRLRCEYLQDPCGVDVVSPRLGWWVTSPRRGAHQVGYQVHVASSQEQLTAGLPDLWDSGRVASTEPCQLPYGGVALTSRSRCFWRVRVWDDEGTVSAWSQPATWEMGLLEAEDWEATWVADPARAEGGRPSYLRKELSVEEVPASARAYVTAHGLYRLSINGTDVSDELFRPGWTDYDQRTPYQVYDVTSWLEAGENVIGVVLADGWYSGQVAWVPRHLYGKQPWLLLQLEVTTADGRTRTTVTDESWAVADGPLLEADILGGERYDARAELPGWDRPGTPGGQWRPVRVGHQTTTALRCHRGPAVRRTQEVKPVAITTAPSGQLVYDLGQNLSGWARLRVRGEAGQAVRLVFGEVMADDGEVYVENLRGARATDEYVLAGTGEELWEPSFTYHGFRYVGVDAAGLELDLDSVTGVAVHSDTPVAGLFSCSSPLLEQLQSNITWGQRSNFLEVPTDCPQRDERLGWLGDAQIFAGTAAFNMDVAAFFTKWLDDVFDAQRPDGAFPDIAPEIRREFNGKPWPGGAPGWGDAGVIVPWTMLLQYGDLRLVRDNLQRFAAWVEYVRSHNPDLVWREEMNNNYGDWLSVGETTPKEVVATSYFFHSTSLVARMANAVGDDEAAGYHSQLAERIRTAFLAAFVDDEGRIAGDTQTAYVLALRFGIAEGPHREQVIGHLARRLAASAGRLSTGFLGVGHVMHSLTDAGMADTAFRVLLGTEFPSWGYSIEHGATTMWERWDGWTEHAGFQDPHMNSFNHYAFGAVGEWMYANLGGIAPVPEAPGYRRIRVHPRPGHGVTWASAGHDSVRGRIETSWRVEEGTFSLTVDVPPTSVAEVHLPGLEGALESGVPLSQAAGVLVQPNGTVEVCSGRYSFTVPFEGP